MKVLVTGGSGFLGSHVADALSDAGHQVVIFDIRPSAYLRSDQTAVMGSVVDSEALARASEGCEAIYHFAAVADIGAANSKPGLAIEVNVMGTVKTLEAARQAGVKRYVLASSIYVYSQQGGFYRTSKQAAEHLVENYFERYALPFTVLRFSSLYGPRATSTNTIYRLVKQALNERRLTYEGSGREMREYIHVLDCAAAAVEILQEDYENEIVHLTGHDRMTTRDMMEMIAEIVGGNVSLELNSGTMEGHYVRTPYSYIPKLGRKLIRRTYVDLGLGLLDLLQHVDNNAPAAGG
ncbi:MAG: NAD(P)-dependent oxidoreductase [Methylocystis sp.]|nr:NAD(P)-dependent oxidoreductase [Methylocystis sp.]